jgi:hypothetical protein
MSGRNRVCAEPACSLWISRADIRLRRATLSRVFAVEEAACDHANVLHRPRLLSDDGPRYIAGELADYLDGKDMAMYAARPSIGEPRARSNAGTRP